MTLGERIKELRRKNNLTQEKLADFLCVSYQAVSKWERDVSSPDLSLIIPLARIFHISADELLGVNTAESDKRYDELRQAYDHTYKTEDFVERQRICELAVSEYPGDMRWLTNLAWVVSNRSFEYTDNDKYIAEQEKAIKLFDAVIKNCKDDILRGNAIQGITQLLGWRGRRSEARKYAELIPERTMITREAVLENILEGDDLCLFRQKRIMRYLSGILWDLSLMPTVCTDTMRDIVHVMFPDGNLLEFHHHLYYAAKKEINHRLKDANISAETLVDLLTEMQTHAQAYDEIVFKKPGVYRYTAPSFDRIEEDTREWLGNEGIPMTQDFRDYLNESQFDTLRHDPAFIALFG